MKYHRELTFRRSCL